MTDAHTPRVLSDADMAADLAGLPRPGGQMANYTLTIVADSGYESTTEGRCSAVQYSAAIFVLHNEGVDLVALSAERDALAVRVSKLEGALKNARDDLADWARYTGDYFHQKYDLAGDLAAIDAALTQQEKTNG